jgi:hypothetical protein
MELQRPPEKVTKSFMSTLLAELMTVDSMRAFKVSGHGLESATVQFLRVISFPAPRKYLQMTELHRRLLRDQ